MPYDDTENQPKALRPTGEPLQGPTAEQRFASERDQAWDYYARGGGGHPEYFGRLELAANERKAMGSRG